VQATVLGDEVLVPIAESESSESEEEEGQPRIGPRAEAAVDKGHWGAVTWIRVEVDG
jgi:hypothetical protein